MIREHEFNTRWWGSPVGILDDAAYFDLDTSEQAEECSGFAWIEYSAPLDSAPSRDKMGLAGFHQVDTQIPFRIGMSGIESTPGVARLSAISADETPFEILPDDFMPFVHERFGCLPGMSAERLNERYAIWSNLLIEKQPAWCFQILDGSDVQGWFLSQAQPDKPIDLTLAMLKADARISGLVFYRKALLEYAARGEQVGRASFSVANTSVMNIYAHLGAWFLPPRGHWLRWSADAASA